MNFKIQRLMICLILFQSHAFATVDANNRINLNSIRNDYRSGQFASVIESTKKFLKIAPENEEAKEILAYSLFQTKDFKGVINLFSESQIEFMVSPKQLKLRTIAQVREGNYYSAMIAYRNLREDEVLKKGWKSYYHYLVFKNNNESAFKELKRMDQVSPQLTNNILLGDLYALAGNYDKAIEAFELALKKDYLNLEAMEKLADNYSRKQSYEKAIVVYQSILKIKPEYSDIKFKIVWNMEKNGNYLKALNLLENDQNNKVLAYKKKLSIRMQEFLNPQSTRSLAMVEDASPIDGKLALEEKFIPMPPLEIANEDSPIFLNSSSSSPVIETEIKLNKEYSRSLDRSTLEINLGPKAKRYDLNGVGFNAHVNYSSGISAGVKYSFIPGSRIWETSLSLDHSKTTLKNLRGLAPSDVTLLETKIDVKIMYKFNFFKIGPALMYERMSTTQTAPNPIRGDVNFVNLGLSGSFNYSLNNNLIMKTDLGYFSKIATTSKSVNMGSVESRKISNLGLKLFYAVDPTLDYFIGVSYANTNTSYSASSLRGTIAAKEKEQDVTFPLGINYAF